MALPAQAAAGSSDVATFIKQLKGLLKKGGKIDRQASLVGACCVCTKSNRITVITSIPYLSLVSGWGCSLLQPLLQDAKDE